MKGFFISSLRVLLFVVVVAVSFLATALTSASATRNIYLNYRFDDPERIVHVGIQPLWLPGNLVTEVMRRDRVLHEELARLGLRLQMHGFLKGADVNQFLLNGKLVAGVGGDMPAIAACAEGAVRVLSMADLNFTSIIASSDFPIQELRHRRIGYAYGSNAHFALLKILAAVELTEDDVSLVQMDVDEMPQALQEGRIDAFSAWEPTPAMALVQEGGGTIISRTLSTGYLYFSRHFLDSRPQAAKFILAAQVRALDWLEEAPDNLLQASDWAMEAGAVLSKQVSPLTMAQYADTARRALRNMATLPLISDADLAPQGHIIQSTVFLKRLGKVADTVSVEQIRACFDRSWMLEVLGRREDFRLGETGQIAEFAP